MIKNSSNNCISYIKVSYDPFRDGDQVQSPPPSTLPPTEPVARGRHMVCSLHQGLHGSLASGLAWSNEPRTIGCRPLPALRPLPGDRSTSLACWQGFLARIPSRSHPTASIGQLLLQALWAPRLLHHSLQQVPPTTVTARGSELFLSFTLKSQHSWLPPVFSSCHHAQPGVFQPRPQRGAKPEEQEWSVSTYNNPTPDTVGQGKHHLCERWQTQPGET